MRKFAISDIHGCNRTFNALLKKIGLTRDDELYLLGDYIDRGPDSKGVLDTIFRLQNDRYFVKCLKGNHEEGILKSRTDRDQMLSWHMYWGGEQTLQSYAAESLIDIPRKYWNFLENLPLYFEVDEYILLHAGLNFDIENPLEDKHSMLWVRDWYPTIEYGWLKNRIVIHGHTPVRKTYIEACADQIDDVQALNIDNGCFYVGGRDKGQMVALEMTERKLFFQDNLDDMTAYFG